jgi:hypothetical protein
MKFLLILLILFLAHLGMGITVAWWFTIQIHSTCSALEFYKALNIHTKLLGRLLQVQVIIAADWVNLRFL